MTQSKTNKIKRTNFASFSIRGIPEGCKYCIRGEKLVLFVTGKCRTKCLYCPLSKLRKNSSKIWANEKECKNIGEVLEEVRESRAKGAGITGGDPLLVFKRTIKYARALKQDFGKRFHIHVYLSTKLVTKDKLRQLSKYIDEVRFHPDHLLNKDRHEEDIKKISIARDYFPIKNIGIEIPIFPDKKEVSFQFIKKIAGDISFVNLNELEIGDSNHQFISKHYKLDKEGYTIKDSISSGKWIMNQCIKHQLKLGVHLCTAETKNWFQYKNRLLQHKIMPFGKRTKDGTVIYYYIAIRNKSAYKKNEVFFDKKNKRLILNPKHISKFSRVKIIRSEEFPTYDQIPVERDEIN
jgi:uncharacterized protein